MPIPDAWNAVKAINHLADDVMKVFSVPSENRV